MSNTVIKIDDGDDATDMSSKANFTLDPNRPKRKRKSSKEKMCRDLKVTVEERKKRQDKSFRAVVLLINYTDTIEIVLLIQR